MWRWFEPLEEVKAWALLSTSSPSQQDSHRRDLTPHAWPQQLPRRHSGQWARKALPNAPPERPCETQASCPTRDVNVREIDATPIRNEPPTTRNVVGLMALGRLGEGCGGEEIVLSGRLTSIARDWHQALLPPPLRPNSRPRAS
jgi:hypothetical protein